MTGRPICAISFHMLITRCFFAMHAMLVLYTLWLCLCHKWDCYRNGWI